MAKDYKILPPNIRSLPPHLIMHFKLLVDTHKCDCCTESVQVHISRIYLTWVYNQSVGLPNQYI